MLEALDLRGATLLGWSLGVFDALSYLDQFGPEGIASLVLVDESPKIVKDNEDDWGEGNAEEVAGLIEVVNGPGYLSFFREYMAAGFEGEAPAALLDEMTETASALRPSRAAALLDDATRQDFRALSTRVAEQMPVMQILRKDWADAAKRWIGVNQPRARVEVLGGHLMLVEYPAAFNAMVLSFLGGSRLSTTRRSRHSRSRWCARPDPRPRTR